MHALVTGAHEADAGGDVVVEVAAGSGGDFDLRADAVTIALAAYCVDEQPMVAAYARIQHDTRPRVKGGNHEIHETVVVQINDNRAAMEAGAYKVWAEFLGHVREAYSIDVAEHRIVLASV